MPLLNFIKRYSEVLCLGGFFLYWFWDVNLSASFSDFNAKDWMSMASTLATLTLSLVALYGINSWRNEYKNKRRFEAALDFADDACKALAVIKDSTQQLQQNGRNSGSKLVQSKKISNSLKKRLAKHIDLINNLSFKRFHYKNLLGVDAYNLCQDIPLLVQDIDYYAGEYVQHTKRLLDIPSDEEVEGAYINGKSWLAETRQQRNECKKEIDECWQWMSLGRNSIVKTKIENFQKRVDRILKANSL